MRGGGGVGDDIDIGGRISLGVFMHLSMFCPTIYIADYELTRERWGPGYIGAWASKNSNPH